MTNTLIHYSIQPQVISKPTSAVNPSLYKNGFQSRYTTVEDFANEVCVKGYMWSGTTYKNSVRDGSHFVLADTYSLDIDNKDDEGLNPLPSGQMTTPQMMLDKHPLSSGICLIYHSASSTEEHPRFRVVFKLPTVIRDRKEFRLFSHRFWAVSAAVFSGLDATKDEARLWYGGTKGACYIKPDAAIDIGLMLELFRQLPEATQKQAELEAVRRVSSRDELIQQGYIEEQEECAFVGDQGTDAEIFKLCLGFLPAWRGDSDGWYQENCWILGAAVASFGVDLAGEVLEAAWGPWPRERELHDELTQWERDHSNPVGFGSVVEAAKKSDKWFASDTVRLKQLQAQGLERAGFSDKYKDTLGLDAVTELLNTTKVDTEASLAPCIEGMSITERMEMVEKGITQIVREADRRRQGALVRNLNQMFQSPYERDDLKSLIKSATTRLHERHREGNKPLIGIDAIWEAVDKADETSGYLVKNVIPMAGCTLVGGPPKVGKTSSIVAMLTRAFLGQEEATGLKSKPFSHLTIFSDDQRSSDTGRYINAALKGLPDPEAAKEKLRGKSLEIYPSLTLDEDGIERLSHIAKTGEHRYCFVGHWESEEKFVVARPQMSKHLESVRELLDEITPEQGITDPVSGPVLIHSILP